MLATTPAAVGGARLASRNAAAPLRAAASKGNPIFALTPRGRAPEATRARRTDALAHDPSPG